MCVIKAMLLASILINFVYCEASLTSTSADANATALVIHINHAY
jgi:hypothetical protein